MGAAPLVPGDPRQLGKYWVAGRLGAGGQGVVYEAYDPAGTRVAIKTLHGELLADARREMLAREVRALRRVASFCTARVLEADLESTPPYVVSEFVPGPDLQRSVDGGGAYTGDALQRLAVGVATALAAIHQAGVVHRDLKPANVLLGPDGPRVIDFGLARTEDMTRSRTGMKGTPRYMAPEVITGGRAGPAADVWAWGAVVLFAALGRPPFEGDGIPALMDDIMNRRPDLDVLPEPLRSVVAAALSKDPAERPTARQVLMSLIGGAEGDAETGVLLAAGSEAAGGALTDAAPPLSLGEEAEAVYARLDPAAQEAVPRVLLRMVLPGEGAADTLRKAHAADFADDEAAGRVVEAFTAAGLLVAEDDTVAIANAALLRAWPRLREWVDADRDGLPIHQSLAEAARIWDSGGRKSGDLYQGTRLRLALDWAATGRRYLMPNAVERAFLEAGAALTRRRIRLRGLVTGALAVLLVVTIAAMAVVVEQHRTVTRQRDQAVAVRLADRSQELRGTDPRTGRRLAVAAGALADDKETHQAMLSALYQWQHDVFVPPGGTRRNAVTLSPDGDTVISGTGTAVRMWDAETHREIREFPADTRVPHPVALSPDGRTAVTRVTPNNGQLFDVATGRPIGGDLGPGQHRFRFSHSGNLLMVDSGSMVLKPNGEPQVRKDGKAELWDVRSRRVLLDWDEEVIEWAVSPDDRYVALSFDRRFELWDLARGAKVPASWLPDALEDEQIRKVAFGPRGRNLILVTAKDVWSFDLTADPVTVSSYTGARLVLDQAFPFQWPDVPAFSSDGRYMAIGFTMWDLQAGGGEPIMDYRIDKQVAVDCRFGRDDRALRCVMGNGSVVSMDVAEFTERTRLPISESRRLGDATRFSGNGELLVLFDDGEADLWNVRRRAMEPGRLKTDLPYGSFLARDVALSPDGRRLAIRVGEDTDARIEVWDTRTRGRVASLRPPVGSLLSPVPPAFSPDGRTVSAVVGEELWTWSVASGDVLNRMEIRASEVQGELSEATVAFTSDGRFVAVGGYGLVEYPSGRVKSGPLPFTRLWALSPDGTKAFGVTDSQEAVLWDVNRRSALGPAMSALQDERRVPLVTAAAFSPDGSLLATGDREGRVRLWDTATGRQFGLIVATHADEVKDLVFSADGGVLHSVARDGHIRTSPVSPQRVRAALCEKAGEITEQEWKRYMPQVPFRRVCQE
ncbi:WD40 repeat domain-containing serine/threonine protein kinase [Thermomonospora catenispora]|uniref:WD40 repeat domain-containing serine/threonine protein kinase n=1 Tax=Thermomonospora catenispora TaxID=2493090 RepID=UPI0013763E8A|nr:WD40 repeat domain-containing serine/threonine-protein kinase [Thermomonospora catenispora]